MCYNLASMSDRRRRKAHTSSNKRSAKAKPTAPKTRGESNDSAVPDGSRVQSVIGPTTRKTIEVPEDYFYQVKQRALNRRIKEKELWAEILAEYFERHGEG
jgi:hypothetical protein